MGGITRESAYILYTFLRNEEDMDDNVERVAYYNGLLAGMSSVMNGEIFSREIDQEIKAYGIEVIEHPTSVARNDRRPS
jgi:hypothetical protein|tara:strand:+ start:2703 stop:2939 length:237 start_codon:yes stop_codon:yes gene_type:complete